MVRKLKKVHGVGVNDAEFYINPTVGGRQRMDKAYQVWKSMLCRCYSEYSKTASPSYAGCEVAEEWKIFSNFKSWFDANYVEGWEIDKDILGKGKLYSQNTCIFVPSWVNCFVLGRNSARGKSPVGVHKSKGNSAYVAMCSHPITKRRMYLGSFGSSELAAAAWLNRKLEVALELKEEMDGVDLRVYPGVIRMIKEMYSGGPQHAPLSQD